MTGLRTLLPPAGFSADANVQPRHPADSAAWIWHPECALGETAFLRFSVEFSLEAAATHRLHVSADQRFQLRVDGVEVGYGPDRGDVEKWPVATYELFLTAGSHRCEALVWWLKDETLTGLRADPALAGASAQVRPPVAQATWRGGFLLAGEGALAPWVTTGVATWHVENLTAAVRPVHPAFPVYHDIGPEFHIQGAGWTRGEDPQVAVSVLASIAGNPHGVQRPGWRLHPASLPEQVRSPVKRGRLRAWLETWTDAPFRELHINETNAEAKAWSSLLSGDGEVVVPAHSERTVLWDFEDYVCGYASPVTQGGAGARVRIDWAEALHEAASRDALTKHTEKGHRSIVTEKIFVGFGDEFFATDGAVSFPAWWWRSGRYLRVQVRTTAEPLIIGAINITSTGYPLGTMAVFNSDDEELNQLAARCERTTRACAHEVWADCPYYEQMAYVGDARLAALGNYALFFDDRLSRRLLEIFDDSRRVNGLVAERAPSAWQQVSVTYSLLWVLMVRDFAWWRDDGSFVRERLRGVRAMVEEVWALTDAENLLRAVPGWSFVDWVPTWSEGCGPGVREGDSSIVNLHLLLALQAQAELENHFGEPELAALAERRAARLGKSIRQRFWCDARGLLADTGRRDCFSEHAQALGLLAELDAPGGSASWVDAWLASNDLARATIYFSFYCLEALRRAGRTEELHARVQPWRAVLPTGLLTLPESPEPTRSDCHGWSAHWRWHLAASVAGVRPGAPGFARVEITPQFGPLSVIESEVRHPRGGVRVSLRRQGEGVQGCVELPAGVAGEFRWNNQTRALRPGKNQIDETELSD